MFAAGVLKGFGVEAPNAGKEVEPGFGKLKALVELEGGLGGNDADCAPSAGPAPALNAKPLVDCPGCDPLIAGVGFICMSAKGFCCGT